MDESESNKAITALNLLVKRKQHEIKELQSKIEMLNTNKANLSFQLEREQFIKRGAFWWLLLLSLELLKFTACSAKQFVLVFICEYAFLAMWRGFYVKNIRYAGPVAICAVALSLYFLK